MNKFVASLTLLSTGLTAATASAQINVIMSNLDNPRGLALGPDGGVYVAETGRGGTGTQTVAGTNTVQFGATGAVSRFLAGAQTRVINGLPSLAPQTGPTPGGGATGLHDIAFVGTDLYGVIGLGNDPATRAVLAADSTSFAQLVRLPLGAAPVNVADLGAHEATANPDGGLPDTNPYALLPTAAGFAVIDAGGNALLDATTAGAVTTRSVFPNLPNPLPVGGPTYQAVPTTLAVGPDAALYVGQLTGFPFPPGAANVFRIDPATGTPAVFASGFTNIIDIAFASDGDLLVLQITTNGLASESGPGPGQLIRVDAATGLRSTLLSSPLFFPGALLVAPDDTLYVSNRGTSPGTGQVLHLIPEPSTLSLLPLAATVPALSPRGRRRPSPNYGEVVTRP